MTHITITDLALDAELDRAAMAAIAGGSRASTGQAHAARHSTVCSGRGSRVIDYPPGFAQRGAGAGPGPSGQRDSVT